MGEFNRQGDPMETTNHAFLAPLLIAAIFGFTGLAPKALADNSTPTDSTTHILQSDTHNASVTLDSSHSQVTVKLLRANEESPSSVQLTFWDQNSKPLTLELKALPSPESATSEFLTYTGTLPARLATPTAGGSASLSPSQQSFVGIELRIPLSKGGADTLRVRGD